MQLTRILGLWILCFATAALLSPLFFPTLSAAAWLLLLLSSGLLIFRDITIIQSPSPDFTNLFRTLNVHVLLLTLLLGLPHSPMF